MKIIIGLIALVACWEFSCYPARVQSRLQKIEAKIEDKIYVAVEEAGEIAVIGPLKIGRSSSGLTFPPILAG